MGRHGLQECVTGHVGQTQCDVVILPRPHHLAWIADAELFHQRPKLRHRGRHFQVFDDVCVEFALGQEPLSRATLGAARIEVEGKLSHARTV